MFSALFLKTINNTVQFFKLYIENYMNIEYGDG